MDPFQNALNSLTPEDREHYMKLGKALYGGINYATQEVLTNSQPLNAEVTVYIELGLKSGLHPNDLTEAEFGHLNKQKGAGWWKQYGYSDDDIDHVLCKKQSDDQVNDQVNDRSETVDQQNVQSEPIKEKKVYTSASERKLKFNRRQ
jgi:hypothetical protein